MLYWVIYDITDNSVRSKVSSICKNYGLKRVQKSAFLGELTRNKAEMLALDCDDVIEGDDAVFVVPTCESCFKERIITGHLEEEDVRKKDWHFVGREE